MKRTKIRPERSSNAAHPGYPVQLFLDARAEKPLHVRANGSSAYAPYETVQPSVLRSTRQEQMARCGGCIVFKRCKTMRFNRMRSGMTTDLLTVEMLLIVEHSMRPFTWCIGLVPTSVTVRRQTAGQFSVGGCDHRNCF